MGFDGLWLVVGAFLPGFAFKITSEAWHYLLVYLVSYGIGRFWVEGLRTDSLMVEPLRIAQVISLIGIVLDAIGLI